MLDQTTIIIYETDKFTKLAGVWLRNNLLYKKIGGVRLVDMLTDNQRGLLKQSIYYYNEQRDDHPKDKFGPMNNLRSLRLPEQVNCKLIGSEFELVLMKKTIVGK